MPILIPSDPTRYASVSDLVRRFGEVEVIQLSDDAGVVINEDRCHDALEDAASEIDIYLAGRYVLPLATVPRVLVNWCCDLARANLQADRITDLVQQRQSAARDMLKAIRDGKTTLGLDVQQQPVATNQGPQSAAAPRVFTGDTLSDYVNPGAGASNWTNGGTC